jgi:UDP-N-acetyl-D-glucosamine/UDP-N-acetyl-D-galactosamine dehydrogenase
MDIKNLKIAVIGLGYVGLPVAAAFSRAGLQVQGFDVNAKRVEELARGIDRTGEITSDVLKDSKLKVTTKIENITGYDVFVVCVPTPIDENRQPDLSPVQRASETVGKALKKDAIVIYESTVYPGVTEDICGPILAKASGLKRADFKLAYSPERINPGDKEHTIETITKVVSGEDTQTLEIVAALYATIVKAGVHKAPSIKVAESAKVIENIQRDLNIALMNELAIIFDKLDIRTKDVLAASRTKWNFIPFTPGLVGGHCIGVDPYYLTARAEQVGYSPQVILSGRRINDGMGAYVAQKLIRLLVKNDIKIKGAKIGILGVTFKENVPDIRNSRVPDIVKELREFGIDPLLHDPLADASEVDHEYGLNLVEDIKAFSNLDGIILAVPHKDYLDHDIRHLKGMMSSAAVLIDLKSALSPSDFKDNQYWSL